MTTIVPIPAVAFVGKQNSGKTTLLVKLIAELTARGMRVGTVKHHSHAGFEFDIEGKDSWRHRQAGSRFAVIAAPDQIASVQLLDASVEVPLERIIAHMADTAPELDVVLVEGYRQSGLPTIEIFRAANLRDIDRHLGGEGNHIIAVVTDIPRVVEEAASFGGDDFADGNLVVDSLTAADNLAVDSFIADSVIPTTNSLAGDGITPKDSLAGGNGIPAFGLEDIAALADFVQSAIIDR